MFSGPLIHPTSHLGLGIKSLELDNSSLTFLLNFEPKVQFSKNKQGRSKNCFKTKVKKTLHIARQKSIGDMDFGRILGEFLYNVGSRFGTAWENLYCRIILVTFLEQFWNILGELRSISVKQYFPGQVGGRLGKPFSGLLTAVKNNSISGSNCRPVRRWAPAPNFGESRFVLEAIFKPLISKSSRSSKMITLNCVHPNHYFQPDWREPEYPNFQTCLHDYLLE